MLGFSGVIPVIRKLRQEDSRFETAWAAQLRLNKEQNPTNPNGKRCFNRKGRLD